MVPSKPKIAESASSEELRGDGSRTRSKHSGRKHCMNDVTEKYKSWIISTSWALFVQTLSRRAGGQCRTQVATAVSIRCNLLLQNVTQNRRNRSFVAGATGGHADFARPKCHSTPKTKKRA